jgi:hypothetical protein
MNEFDIFWHRPACASSFQHSLHKCSISNIKDLHRDLLFIVLMLGSPSWTSYELLARELNAKAIVVATSANVPYIAVVSISGTSVIGCFLISKHAPI